MGFRRKNPVALRKKKGGFVHINCRHKAQLHIKTLITHLVTETNVLTIETPRETFVSTNLHLRPIACPEHLLPNLSSCIYQNVVGRKANNCFIVEPYGMAHRSAYPRSGPGIQMHDSRVEQCMENSLLPPAL